MKQYLSEGSAPEWSSTVSKVTQHIENCSALQFLRYLWGGGWWYTDMQQHATRATQDRGKSEQLQKFPPQMHENDRLNKLGPILSLI